MKFSGYATSKVIEILVVRQLATIINSSDAKSTVVINTVDPGLCNSELVRESPFSVHLLKFILEQSCEKGSKNYIVAASLGSEGNGKYISYGRITRSVIQSKCALKATVLTMTFRESPFVNTEEGARTGERVWAELSQILQRIQPNILQSLE